ncbi:MAG: DUF4852 domain-containing protein [Pseudomonadota bacterium]
MFKKFSLVAVLLALVSFMPVHAQTGSAPKKNVIYETPTFKTLSQLYWALMKFDSSKDIYIDNFLLINECDLYRDYVQNEFEWKGIREGAREFLQDNRKSFPTHFEFLQPVRLAEYDLESEAFDVWQPYKIKGVRRFEVLAEDFYEKTCGVGFAKEIIGYPKGLYIELNRPFSADKIKVKPEVAEAYIQMLEGINRDAGIVIRNKEDLYESRAAYLVMKLRVFSFKEDVDLQDHRLSKVLAVLEGYEIYGDRDREMLLFSEDFSRKKKRSAMEMEMKRKYQERLKKQLEAERKAAQEAAAETP